MAYTTAEGRQELMETITQAIDELAFASACLAEAYERLDEHNADLLEEACFRPVQMAFGRAKRTQTEFAARHGLRQEAFQQVETGLTSQSAAAFVERAVEAAGSADQILADLQDTMLPIEAGDEELRTGLRTVREPLDGLSARARDLLRGLGR